MSRPPKFALGLAAFGVGAVVAPVVVTLLFVDAGLPVVAAVAVPGSLLVGGVGYALGTAGNAARLGASRFGVLLTWVPVVLALSVVPLVELDVPDRVLLAVLVGIVVGHLGGAFAWGAAASERAERATTGKSPSATWEGRPRPRWWHDERTVATLAVAALVAFLVLSATVLPDSSSLWAVATMALAGLFGLESQKNRRRTYAAYEHGVTVESGDSTVFYGWDRIRGVDRTADGLVLRPGFGPLTDLDARAEDVDDPDALASTLRELRSQYQ